MADPKITTLKDEIKAINQLSKLQEGLNKSQREQLNYLRDSLKELLQANKQRAAAVNQSKSLLGIAAQLKDNIAKGSGYEKVIEKVLRSHLDIEKQLLKNTKKIGDATFQRVDFIDIETTLKEKSKYLTEEELKHTSQLLETEKLRADLQVKMNKQAEEAVSLIDDQVNRVESLIQSLPGGNFLASMFDFDKIKEGLGESIKETFKQAQGEFAGTFAADNLGAFSSRFFSTKAVNKFTTKAAWVGNKIGTVFTFAVMNPFKTLGIILLATIMTKMLKDTIGFANELGLSYGQAVKLGPALLIGSEQAKALVNEFGTLDEVTAEVTTKMRILEFRYGQSTETTAKLMHNLKAISGLTSETAISTIKWIGDLARARDVSPASVLEDIASNTEFFADYGKAGGENLAVAAVEAKRLGVNLDTVSGIAESLLEFESSIEKQMEASILLGREINLDRVRRLAFTGDMVGMQREILSIVGSQSQFEALNVIQRRALAESLGLSTVELSKMITNQAKLNEMTINATSAAKAWDKTMTSIGDKFAAILPILKWIGLLSSVLLLPFLLKGVSYIWMQNKALWAQLITKKKIAQEEKKSVLRKGIGGAGGLGVNPAAMLKGAAAILIMAGAIFVLGKALQQFVGLDWKQLGLAAVALGGLIAFAGVANVFGPALLIGAGVIAVLAGSLLLFGTAMKSVGTGISMISTVFKELAPLTTQIAQLGKSFGSVGVGFMKLAAGAALIAPFLPGLLALGGLHTAVETTTTIDLTETNTLLRQLINDNNKLMNKNIMAIERVEKAVKRSKLDVIN